jgi:lipoyl synthase
MSHLIANINYSQNQKQLPFWFLQDIPNMEPIRDMKKLLRDLEIHTVCESAHCPNIGKCWGQGVATFMILGDICTRACRFCAVKTGRPLDVDLDEPYQVAKAVSKLNLKYVVITSVARDDLKDDGADHFARTIQAIRALMPNTKIEVLIPDFSNKESSLRKIIEARPEVISHNIETIRRLSPDIRAQADFDRSLEVLYNLKRMGAEILTKTGFMLGLGETHLEIVSLMKDLARVKCDLLTIGQYLAPTTLKRHVRVQRFAAPEEFEMYKQLGLDLGFRHVMSGPLVRSSFMAEEGYYHTVR